MRCVRWVLIIIVCINAVQLAAQQKFTWKGYIKDSLSGETLINASVLLNNETRGVTTNQYGYFALTLPAGNYQLIFSYVGYLPKIITVDFDKDRAENILLTPVSGTI